MSIYQKMIGQRFTLLGVGFVALIRLLKPRGRKGFKKYLDHFMHVVNNKEGRRCHRDGGTAALKGEARKQCFGFKLHLDNPMHVVNKKKGRSTLSLMNRPTLKNKKECHSPPSKKCMGKMEMRL